MRSQSKLCFFIASWASHTGSKTAKKLGHYCQYAGEKKLHLKIEQFQNISILLAILEKEKKKE